MGSIIITTYPSVNMFTIFLIFTVGSAAASYCNREDGRLSQSLKNFPQQVVSDLQYQHDLGAGGDVHPCEQCEKIDIPIIYASASNVLAGELVDELTDGEAVCAAVVAGESILMAPIEMMIYSYLMETFPPYAVCVRTGYCSGNVTSSTVLQ